METKYYKVTLYNDGTFEVSDYKGDADTLIKTPSICGFVRLDEEKFGVYEIRQSKKTAINAIRKHVKKELIRAKEDVDKLEKILLQLK